MEIARVGTIKQAWGEGAAWDTRNGRLYTVDCVGARVAWLDDGAEQFRVADTATMVTVVHLTDDLDTVTLSLDDGIHLFELSDGATRCLVSLPAANAPRLNDSVVDARGRIVTGHFFLGAPSSDAPPPKGAYWSLGADGNWHKIDEGKGNTNGPCFSPDGSTFYVADSSAARIYAFDYDLDCGTLSNCRLLIDTQSLGGIPDGCKVDTDGCLWSALFASSRLVRITPDGGHDRTVELPTTHPTDIVFGGPNLDVAYVTTVGMRLGTIVPEGELAGAVLRIDGLGVSGMPEHTYTVAA